VKTGTCRAIKVLCLSRAHILRSHPTAFAVFVVACCKHQSAVLSASGRKENEGLGAERGLPHWYKLAP
jgi:hypothetical protein